MNTIKIITLVLIIHISVSSFGQKYILINVDENGKDTIDLTDKYYYKDSNLLYFPNQLFYDTINYIGQERDSAFYKRRNDLALYMNTWFSKQLSALDEPKLYKDYDFETYRFTWLRTFHNPISIRLEKKNNEYLLFVKRANGAGGYNPGQLVQNDTILITESQWDDVISKIYNLNFWKIPTVERSNLMVMDGAEWIFEARKNGKYNMVYRQTSKGTEIKELCMMLYNLSNLKIKKKEIY
jgi:hypothetical protein